MNAHRRRPAGTQRPTPKNDLPATGRRRETADAYVHPLLGNRVSDRLFSGTFVRSSVTADPETLTAAYRENWLARRIIDMPSEDMTRAWYTLKAALPPGYTEQLRRLEARHSVKQELTDAIRWARLYGGAIALIVIRGDEERLDTPLELSRLRPGCFQGLLVLDRASGVMPSDETVTDLDDPDFGLPMYYTAELEDPETRPVTLHHSRVLRFTGRELPLREALRENGWGASELEHLWEELQKRCDTSANIARLVFQANVTTLKMSDFGELLALGTDQQREQVLSAIEEQDRMRTSFGLQLLSAGDSYENHPYSFAGLAEVYEAFMMDMAGAAGIPATRLFGRSPQGMNATGESDLKNYYEMIAGLQERMLRPALERLVPVMAMSCWGAVPPGLEICFEPVMTVSRRERAEIAAKEADTAIRLLEAGIITSEEARERVNGDGSV